MIIKVNKPQQVSTKVGEKKVNFYLARGGDYDFDAFSTMHNLTGDETKLLCGKCRFTIVEDVKVEVAKPKATRKKRGGSS